MSRRRLSACKFRVEPAPLYDEKQMSFDEFLPIIYIFQEHRLSTYESRAVRGS